MSVNFKENGELVPVSGGSGLGEVVDVSDKLTTVSTTTSTSKHAYVCGNLVNLTARFDNNVNFEIGHNKIGHFDGKLPSLSTRVIIISVKSGGAVYFSLVGSLRANASGYTDGDITVYCPEQFPAGSQFQFNLMYFADK